ncbi:hypothetical protein MOQ72_37125 [Saccharopolyspora sp. K220]|uniref:hypothetical protein n=1 Tax=Saccharopolyspora soli TaxID=2926618 RepID=UPI001F568737|nr:hypothetical protein [Saccharopolyspora soli]MCI2423055.1 hypothetical protein [Saccharopolyspora soli]
MSGFDEIEQSRREIEKLNQEIEENNFVTRVRAQHHRDQADAAQVQAVRELGPLTGQRKHYQKNAEKLERKLGYRD